MPLLVAPLATGTEAVIAAAALPSNTVGVAQRFRTRRVSGQQSL